jgi:hypothetical protein
MSVITVEEFKTAYDRDFMFGGETGPNTTVRDGDITRAISLATVQFNEGLWEDDTDKEIAFGLLTAHCLCIILSAAGGLKNPGRGDKSTGRGPITSKSAGPLSVSHQFPEDILNSPIFSPYLTTQYGIQYTQLIYPLLTGNVQSVAGDTTP